MSKLINLIIGDWSADGHEHTENVLIETKYTRDQIQKAYKAGRKIVGIDLIEDCCQDYQDNELDENVCKKYEELGYGKVNRNPSTEEWAKLFLWTCVLGDKNFKYKVVECDEEVIIGGYGLFE